MDAWAPAILSHRYGFCSECQPQRSQRIKDLTETLALKRGLNCRERRLGCSLVVGFCTGMLLSNERLRYRHVDRKCAAVTLAPKTGIQAKRQLVAEVEILALGRHPKKPKELQIAEVTDPDFPGERVQLVLEANRWSVGDRGLLLQVGCIVPRKVAEFGGLFKELAGAALASTKGCLEGPLDMAGTASQGLLIPLSADTDFTRLSSSVASHTVLQSRVMLDIAFRGDDYRGSSGSDESMEPRLRSALLQAGVVPAGWKPPFQRLSRTDAGVHARNFYVGIPLLKLQASDLQADGTCPKLAEALNRRLPKTLRVLNVARIPWSADLPSACVGREYRYYFPRSLLGPGGGDFDVSSEKLLAAALQRCQGEHSFLNFTRPDQCSGLNEELRAGKDDNRWLEAVLKYKRNRSLSGFLPESRVASSRLLGYAMPEVAKEMTARHLRVCELLPPASSASADSGSNQELLCVRLVGDGFLNNMARLVVGSCCAAARGVLPMDELDRALEAGDIVDLTEFLAPAPGLVLHSQEMDPSKVPWLHPDRSKAAADAYLEEEVMPLVRKAWVRLRSFGAWYRPGPSKVNAAEVLQA
eukprot:TRINITY_DN104554_c0_g1_i1.p1 TRINITY_DN104554_c0_g1~~TRINITY_DN104554_c0_g1_i1.p1  ORF type:complete len:584 (-),score=114.12 TRINITY_DN104554_c0_g1_i1:112-1863(-)